MYPLYQVTLNGSPVHGVGLHTLRAAAYTAACLRAADPADRGDRKAREYGVELVDVVEELTMCQHKAHLLADDLLWSDDTDLELVCFAADLAWQHQAEHDEIVRAAQAVDDLVPA